MKLTNIGQNSITLKVALVDSKRSLSRFEWRRETSPIFKIADHPAVREALSNPALTDQTQQFKAELERGYEMIDRGVNLIPEWKDDLSDIERQHQKLNMVLERLRVNCNEFDESTDPRKIEKLNPEAYKLEVGLASLSEQIRSKLDGPIQRSHEMLDNLETQLRSELPRLL